MKNSCSTGWIFIWDFLREKYILFEELKSQRMRFSWTNITWIFHPSHLISFMHLSNLGSRLQTNNGTLSLKYYWAQTPEFGRFHPVSKQVNPPSTKTKHVEWGKIELESKGSLDCSPVRWDASTSLPSPGESTPRLVRTLDPFLLHNPPIVPRSSNLPEFRGIDECTSAK